MNESTSYAHMYAIKPFGKLPIIVSADDMDKDTARYIARQHYPIYARIFPVSYTMLGKK